QMRINEYVQLYGAAFDFVPSDEAYENWKKHNVKISVLYVAAPFEAQRAKVDAMQPTAEDLRGVQDLPDHKALLKIPAKKTVEIAYVRVEDMTPAEFEAAKAFAEKAELFVEEQPLDKAAFVLFYGKREHVFTKANWGRLVDPDFAQKKAKWD